MTTPSADEPAAGPPSQPQQPSQPRSHAAHLDQDATALLPLRRAVPAADPDATTLIPKVPVGPARRGPAHASSDLEATAKIEMPADLRAPAVGGRKAARDKSRELRNHRKSGRRAAGPAAAGPVDEDDVAQVSMTLSGEIVVPLRAVRTGDGYRSVYSDMTRPSIWSIIRTALRVAGETMITLGLVVLLFAGYEVWGVGAKVNAHQDDLTSQLAQDWNASADPTVSAAGPTASPPTPADGSPLVKLYIPRIKAKPWVVVQGTSETDIRYAPGHYPGTAMAGEIGNFSVAGHRTPAIFWDLDKLKVGDQIVLESKETWFVYTVTESHVVTPTAVSVIAPVPNQPGASPREAMLTVTTCNPKYNNYQRLVVHARLDGTQSHDAGPPAGLVA